MQEFDPARRRAHRLAVLRAGPAATWHAYRRSRARARNEPDADPVLAPSEALALDPALDATQAELDANARVIAAQGGAPLEDLLWVVPWFHNPHGGGTATILRMARHFPARSRLHVYDRHRADDVQRLVPDLPVTAGPQPPPADAAIATSWTSAYRVMRHDRVRAKFFLVQDWEPAFHPAGSASALFDQAAAFGLPGIVNTPGLAELYPHDAVTFTPAVDHATYFERPKPQEGPVRVVAYARPKAARNAWALTLRTLRLVKERCGDRVEVVTAGEDFHPGAYGALDVLRNAGALPSPQAVADLYRSAHVGLVLMLTAHPSYQPLEYMACGAATVSNDNPRTRWLLRHGANALTAPPLPSLLAERVVRLVEDPALRERIAAAGRATVEPLRWEPELDRVWAWMTTAPRRSAAPRG